MKQQPPERTKRLAVIAAAAVILVMVLLIIETFRLLLPGLWTAFSSGDEQALSDYLTSEGRLRSFLTLWFLAFVQVVSLVIPAMPGMDTVTAGLESTYRSASRPSSMAPPASGFISIKALPFSAQRSISSLPCCSTIL